MDTVFDNFANWYDLVRDITNWVVEDLGLYDIVKKVYIKNDTITLVFNNEIEDINFDFDIEDGYYYYCENREPVCDFEKLANDLANEISKNYVNETDHYDVINPVDYNKKAMIIKDYGMDVIYEFHFIAREVLLNYDNFDSDELDRLDYVFVYRNDVDDLYVEFEDEFGEEKFGYKLPNDREFTLNELYEFIKKDIKSKF